MSLVEVVELVPVDEAKPDGDDARHPAPFRPAAAISRCGSSTNSIKPASCSARSSVSLRGSGPLPISARISICLVLDRTAREIGVLSDESSRGSARMACLIHVGKHHSCRLFAVCAVN